MIIHWPSGSVRAAPRHSDGSGRGKEAVTEYSLRERQVTGQARVLWEPRDAHLRKFDSMSR
jgi:hypothetical protein